MSRKSNALVLLAGGKGTRMGTGVHKQFLELGGKPLIWHSLNAAQRSDLIDDIILVSGEDDLSHIRELVGRYGFDKVSMIVKGGSPEKPRPSFCGDKGCGRSAFSPDGRN